MREPPSRAQPSTPHTRTPYAGVRVALLTQHGKQEVLRDGLQDALGCTLVHTDAFDTDQLGTFTRDIAREGSQVEAARRKAELGMQLTGAPVGLASEGAFGPDPFAGMMNWDSELLLWVDATRHLEISAWAQGPAQSAHRLVKNIDELMQFAAEAQFPSHALVVRPAQDHPLIFKGLSTPEALHEALTQALVASEHGTVFVENDLRAHCNPTRQALIRKAGEELARKLTSLCAACGSPGFWVHEKKRGLPCRACGTPTRLPLAEIWTCPACAHVQERAVDAPAQADPAHCDHCNP